MQGEYDTGLKVVGGRWPHLSASRWWRAPWSGDSAFWHSWDIPGSCGRWLRKRGVVLPPANVATPPKPAWWQAVPGFQCHSYAPPEKASWSRRHKDGDEEALRGVGTALLPRRWWRRPPPQWTGVGDLDGSSAEGFLELLEGGSSFGVPRQRLGLLTEHGRKGCWEKAEVLDESAVEVGESEESLEFLDRLRLGPVTDGLDLPLVHLDAIAMYPRNCTVGRWNSHFSSFR